MAEKNIDKNITENELAERKKEVEKVSLEVESLQEKIRRDIPKEARKAVLRDRLNANINLLSQYLKNTKTINEELEQLGSSPEIPPELLKAIESEISPEYLQKEKQTNLKTYLTIVTTSAAIVSAVLPYEIGRILSLILLLIAAPILILLFKTSLPLNQILRKKLLYNIAFGLLVSASIVVLIFFGVMVMVFFSEGANMDIVFITKFCALLTIALSISAYVVRKRARLYYVMKDK